MNAAEPLDRKYVRPRLGRTTAGFVLVLWLLQIGVGATLRAPGGLAVVTTPAGWCWLGLVWGTLAAGVAICAGGSAVRHGALVAVVAWHVVMMHVVRDQPATRYVILMGGYALAHASALRMLALPSWQCSPGDRDRPAPHRQFSILGLLVLTTAAAGLCAALARYSVDHFDRIGTPLAVATLVVVALLAADVSLARGRRLASLVLLGGTLATAPTTLGLLHQWMTQAQRPVAAETASQYAVVITVFATVTACVHGAGRFEGRVRTRGDGESAIGPPV